MRVVVVVFAALLTLGLAAFGVVAAQRANAPAAATAMAAQVAPPAQSARPTPVRAPVADIAQNRIAEVAKPAVATDAPAAAPIVVAQNTRAAPAPAAAAAPQSAAAPAPSPAKSAPTCDKPDGMGLSRTVEIDTTGGPAFGTEHFKQYDFLREKEVVLTFDDGPWPENTPMVIKALTDMCVKGDVLRDRRARHLAPRHFEDGGRGRHDHRQPHLVAQGFGQEALCHRYRAGQARDRDGRERRAYGGRRPDRAVLPLPRSAAAGRSDDLSRHAQYRDLLDRHRHLRLQDAQARGRGQIGDDQARQERQGHPA